MTRALGPSFAGGDPGWPRRDFPAGVTVWAVMTPAALAYAAIAGVPPVVGLYAAVPALLVYAALGTSRHLVVGPMSATAMLSAGVVGSFTVLGGAEAIALTAALALVTGVLGITAGLLRLGFLASLISEPVLKGFIVGLALVIIVGQLPALLGVAGGDGNVVEREWAILTALDTLDALTAAVGMTSLVTVLLLGRVVPMLPGALIVVTLGIVAVRARPGLWGPRRALDRGDAAVPNRAVRAATRPHARRDGDRRGRGAGSTSAPCGASRASPSREHATRRASRHGPTSRPPSPHWWECSCSRRCPG